MTRNASGRWWWALAAVAQLVVAAGAAPPPMLKLSKYDRGQYADLAVDGDGAYHVVFTDRPDRMKPSYLYYRASRDGATWSEPKNLSDDESGYDASYGRIIADAKGRVYAVWKYVRKDELLDGPGGNAAGIVAFRCLEGGAWSRAVRLNDAKAPSFSWFVAPGPDGLVRLVWSQIAPDAAKALGWAASGYANWVQQLTLDGGAPGDRVSLITPRPLPGEAQVEAARRAGKPIPYAEQRPRKEGLINLRGYIDNDGTAQFAAECPPVDDGPSQAQTGKQIVLWNGTRRLTLYTFERFKTFNDFNNPPALLRDADGRQHLLRVPERAETTAVRDYLIEDGKLAAPDDVVGPTTARGTVPHWQAQALPGGRMAVLAAVSEKGGYNPNDVELWVSIASGAGRWGKPVCVTDNAGRQASRAATVTDRASVAQVKTYRPLMGALAIARDGRPALVLVNNEDTLSGIVGSTTSGGDFGARVDAPMVFFTRLP